MRFGYHDFHLTSTIKIKEDRLLTSGRTQQGIRLAIVQDCPAGGIADSTYLLFRSIILCKMNITHRNVHKEGRVHFLTLPLILTFQRCCIFTLLIHSISAASQKILLPEPSNQLPQLDRNAAGDALA